VARRAGARAIVFVPEQASAAKVTLIEAQGAELRRVGADLAVRVAIPLAVAELNPLVQRFELVTERELALAVGAYAEVGIRVEGAAAAPLAVALRESLPRPVVLIVTGRNIDEALWRRAVKAPDSFAA